jgi:hypothetical protein
MVPKSSAWQALRAEALRFIPSPTRLYFKTAIPLREWRTQGSYIVLSSDSKRLVIRAASGELADVLFADVEFLLDQAAEQRTALKLAVQNVGWHSPAWTTVTAYYWSFFSALALTRMVGRSTWFLNKEAVQYLVSLAQTVTGKPGAGTLFFDIEPQAGGDCEMHLVGSGRNNHDAVWHRLKELVTRIFASTDKNSSVDEFRLWWCLSECAKILGDSWPSEIRNDVNYKAGYAYKEVIKNPAIKIAPYIRKVSEVEFGTLLDQFESEVHRIRSYPGLHNDLDTLTKLVALNALILSLIIDEIHLDVLNRVDGDRRWLRLRNEFLTAKCSDDGTRFWPFANQRPGRTE